MDIGTFAFGACQLTFGIDLESGEILRGGEYMGYRKVGGVENDTRLACLCRGCGPRRGKAADESRRSCHDEPI